MSSETPNSARTPQLPDQVAEQMLAEARAEVGYADHKASMVLTAVGVGFGALLGGLLAGDWEPTVLDGAMAVIWWLGAGVAGLSIASAAAAVWPRYQRPRSQPSVVHFWGDVAYFRDRDAFVEAIASDGVAEHRTLDQLWRLSRIVATKYRLVRISIGSAAVSGVLLALSVIG